jgi:2-polyprenyl-6-methoxyphenol hydroxylase-like FAD-dependent oxidoreductase
MAWWAPSSRGASTGNRSDPTGLDIDAHYTLLTHENEATEVVSQGLRRATDEVAARLTRGDQVDPDEYYFRTLVRPATPASETFVFPMIDREPLPRWTFEGTTLLGDAAHPMYPIGSNGASRAILDARVLAGCLRRSLDDPAEALDRYEAVRRPATAAIVQGNRSRVAHAVGRGTRT